MLTVSDLYGSALPPEFLQCLPTHCESCGEENEITETLTILRCSNPSCGGKSVQRLVTLLKDIGVKNMGESKCAKFLDNFDINNPYAIFMYEPEDGPLYEGCSMDFSEAIFEEINKKRQMLLWEFIKIGNMPKIRDSARKLLANYDDLEEFYDDLEAGGISFVQEMLSIKGKTVASQNNDDDFDFWSDEDNTEDVVSVKATDMYNTLIFFKDELFEAIDFIEIKKLTTPIVNICISTSVGKPFTSKSDFVSKMNDEFGDKIHLNALSSVSGDCHVLIWSKEGAPTTKVTKTERINDKRRAKNLAEGLDEDEGLIQILTGLEFRDHLSSL